MCALLGLGGHPIQGFDTLAQRDAQVRDEGLHLGLGFGREVLLDVELSDRIAERPADRLHAALPTLALFGGAGKRGAVEREILVIDRLRQH